ncbi:MAG: 2,3-bisphosphoglycerate-dependent phosphoglycerate mutase [Bryobacteraceae bacterium]
MRLVLMRHGESVWNAENRFTGHTDIDLSAVGVEQARAAARELRRRGFAPDRVFTSHLRRAIRTAWIVLEELDRMWVPLESHAGLNERCFGEFEGKTKAEVTERWGAESLRSFKNDWAWRPPGERGESLQDLRARVRPIWAERIEPAVLRGERVLVAIHGNTLRAMDDVVRPCGRDPVEAEIPPARPYFY